MLDDLLEMRGELRVVLTDSEGRVKEDFTVPNIVTTAGKGLIADRLKAAPAIGPVTHMAVGTSNTAAAVGDTTLSAEVSGSRTALTSTGVAAAVATYIATFGAGVGTGTLQEAGLFNASSAGTMLCRTVFSAITKAIGDSLTITWTVTVG